MLRMLHEKDGLRYTVFTGTYKQTSDLVTLRRRNRKSKTNKNNEAGKTFLLLIEFSKIVYFNSLSMFLPRTSAVINVDKESKDFVKNLVEGLKMRNNEFLFAVAWITKEGYTYGGWDMLRDNTLNCTTMCHACRG